MVPYQYIEVFLLAGSNTSSVRCGLFNVKKHASCKFVKHIDSEHLKFPFHISTDGVDDITVCDRESNEVIAISHDGTGLVTRIAASEHNGSEVCAIYHKDTDRYFVSDSKADLVKVFDKNGNFLYEIGRGKLLNPFGLAIDKFNNLIVCDTGNKRLKVFTTKGDFLSETEQCFHTPRFIAVSKEGKFWSLIMRNTVFFYFNRPVVRR